MLRHNIFSKTAFSNIYLIVFKLSEIVGVESCLVYNVKSQYYLQMCLVKYNKSCLKCLKLSAQFTTSGKVNSFLREVMFMSCRAFQFLGGSVTSL